MKAVLLWMFGAALIAALAWMLLPRDVVIAPRWEVNVRYSDGKPATAMQVLEEWVNYATEDEWHEETLLTSAEGTAVFPERMMRYRRIVDVSAFIKAYGGFSHRSWRSHASVTVRGHSEKLNSFNPSTTKVSTFVLQ
jgi:hypothetical protein